MKTKVSSDNNTEGVSPQTTAVTTTAAQSSVWSICDISTDSHVELRDITPSISPVFTDDQVHELTHNPTEVDVLGEHFLPPDTFKRIDEVLSSGGQANLLYSDPVLSNALKQNHDVLLPGDLSFHGSMFPSFEAIVEADRILNKRDESSDLISSNVSNSEVDPSNSADWPNDATSLANPADDGVVGDDEVAGTEKGPRRSPRKRVQVKKDSESLKSVTLAQKSISRGKDISKLKYANTKQEAPKKEVRRSGRGQKKVEKEENVVDKKTKDTNMNAEKKDTKNDEETEKESPGQQDATAKNVRRSPRNQSKASVEDRQKASRKQKENKKETSTVGDDKETADETPSEKGEKSAELKSDSCEEENKNGTESAEVDKEEKKGIRKSGRITRNKEKQIKEDEEQKQKTAGENNKTRLKDSKVKTEGKKMKGTKSKGETESGKKELSEDDKKNVTKRSDSEYKTEKSESSATQSRERDTERKALERRQVESKIETSDDEEKVKAKRARSEKDEQKEKGDLGKNDAGVTFEKETKSVSKIKDNTREQKDKTDKTVSKAQEYIAHKEEKRSIDDGERDEKMTKLESMVKEEKASDKMEKIPSSKDEQQIQEEGVSEAGSSDEHEEFNEDSDYDPEYDPDRLWCVCRKPHGNRFMICCDHCEEWFHGMCVGITMAQGRQMEKDGQEYICPKCQAKIEEEKSKDIGPTTETTAKEKEENTSSSKHGETKDRKSPTKHDHHSKREHALKIKLPTEKHETRKRRHSSHRQSREETTQDPSSKKSKESDKLFAKEHGREEKKKKMPESKGFKIPKKVRTTPTPASYVHHHTRPKCIMAGCTMLADRHSLYCSAECVKRHAEESLKIIVEEKKKRMGSKPSVSSSKSVTSPTSSLLGPVPWDAHSAPSSSQSESVTPKEGVAVIERSTGRVIAGVAAPSQEELVFWLQDHPTFEVLRPSVGKDEKKKDRKEDSEKAVRENIKKSIKEILTTRSKEQQDLNVTEEDIEKCSQNVEGEMFSFFGDTGHRYKNKYRSLMFNLKDPRNKVLFRHVLSGEITVERLVRMTPEQLASPELATWREQETKHTLEMIKLNQEEINATKAHIKKTHKGEVEIDDDDLSTLENSIKANTELKVEQGLPDSNTSSSTLLLDTTDEHRIHLFDLNCRICTGKMPPPGEPPRRETPSPLVSTTSIVQAVAESSIPSPTPMDIVTSANSPDSATVSQPPVSPSVLSKTPKKVPAVWKGFVMMQNVAKFGTSAYRVSGSCDDLLHLLPDTLHVQGRIAHEQVWDYLLQLKSSTSREVCVIRYEASSDDEKLSYVSLYSYFYSRKRCGVVSNCYTGVKDMYLVPLASHQPIPPELLPFDGPGLDEPRPHMLLGVIVRSKAVFKRPRALSQRSLSPPPKRRTSSASVETSSSEGGTVESPASKRDALSELRDSPPADIDDIVFQYNTTQAKNAARDSKDSSVKASPASETTTPSLASSTGAVVTPAASAEKSPVPSLEEQKQQLLDLQERARQYILAQSQRKGSTLESEATSEDTPESSATANVHQHGGEGGAMEDDAPYDPEEGLVLDLNSTDPTPSKPPVAVTPKEPAKPSSLEMLVSTLQRLQGAASNLSALSAVLPQGASATSKVEPNQPSGKTLSAAASSANVEVRSTNSQGSTALASSILQPIVPGSRELLSTASPDSASKPTVSSSLGSQPLSAAHPQPKPVRLTGHLSQPAASIGDSSHAAISSTQGSQLSPSLDQRLRPGHSSAQRLQSQTSSDQRMQPGPSSDHKTHPGPSSDHRPLPVPSTGQRHSFDPAFDHRLQPRPSSDHRPHPGASSDQRPQSGLSSEQRLQPGPAPAERNPFGSSGDQRLPPGLPSVQRHQPTPSDNLQANKWSPTEPPQVSRQVNNVNQDVGQYSGLRPEDRARLAAHESRLESRENRRSSSDNRDEHFEQRRIDDRHRPGWHNDPRYPRDSRDSRDDSRRNWRDEYRQGRPWYSDDQRRDRHEHPIDERPRHEDRRQERRFREHWSRDRWRR